MKRLSGARELLDGTLDDRLLAGNLRDLERINRLLGGTDLSWRALSRAIASQPASQVVTLLDIGTGAADIPLALIGRARRQGRRLLVEAVDVRPEIVALATARAAGQADVQVRLGDAERLAYADSSFDVVHASLVLHHRDPPAAERLLAEMARLARLAVIVNDLERARRWWLGAWLLTRLATGNRYTRHDGPLSVRRAYTSAEASDMATAAGLRPVSRLRDRLGHRYALVLEPRG